MPEVSAVSVSPTSALPPIVGPARGRRVGGLLLLDRKADLIRRRAGQRCLVLRVVGDDDPHLDGIPLVVGHQRVAGIRLPEMSASVPPSLATHW